MLFRSFIFNALSSGNGSEIFVPKLRAYSIVDVKDALMEMFDYHKEEVIGIRPGEKLHETLINNDEIRYSWEYKKMYMITNPLYPLFQSKILKDEYRGIKKLDGMNVYSSDRVEKFTKNELKKIIKNSGLAN